MDGANYPMALLLNKIRWGKVERVSSTPATYKGDINNVF